MTNSEAIWNEFSKKVMSANSNCTATILKKYMKDDVHHIDVELYDYESDYDNDVYVITYKYIFSEKFNKYLLRHV